MSVCVCAVNGKLSYGCLIFSRGLNSDVRKLDTVGSFESPALWSVGTAGREDRINASIISGLMRLLKMPSEGIWSLNEES